VPYTTATTASALLSQPCTILSKNIPRVSPSMSPRESLDSARERPIPRDDYMPLFLLVAAIAFATAGLHKTCALTGYPNELKRPLFKLIYPVTFMAGPN
jgi:hypothetical protein